MLLYRRCIRCEYRHCLDCGLIAKRINHSLTVLSDSWYMAPTNDSHDHIEGFDFRLIGTNRREKIRDRTGWKRELCWKASIGALAVLAVGSIVVAGIALRGPAHEARATISLRAPTATVSTGDVARLAASEDVMRNALARLNSEHRHTLNREAGISFWPLAAPAQPRELILLKAFRRTAHGAVEDRDRVSLSVLARDPRLARALADAWAESLAGLIVGAVHRSAGPARVLPMRGRAGALLLGFAALTTLTAAFLFFLMRRRRRTVQRRECVERTMPPPHTNMVADTLPARQWVGSTRVATMEADRIAIVTHGNAEEGRAVGRIFVRIALERGQTPLLVEMTAGETLGAPKPGLAELMRGNVSFSAAISRDPETRAHVISAGVARQANANVEEPTEVRLREVFDILEKTYDRIVMTVDLAETQAPSGLLEAATHVVMVTDGSPARPALEDCLRTLRGMTDAPIELRQARGVPPHAPYDMAA